MVSSYDFDELQSVNSFRFIRKQKNICRKISLFVFYLTLVYLIAYYYLIIYNKNDLKK